MYNHKYSTLTYKSQVQKTLAKCAEKRAQNEFLINWLAEREQFDYLYDVTNCATFIGFTDIAGVAHVTKANFCRRRLCNICVWRRQTKFVAQMFPVIDKLRNDGYRFLFATATVPNVPLERLTETINNMMKAYDLFLKRRKVKRAWLGKIRALELTYNSERNDFHPHLHMLIAVKPEYFHDSDLYISFNEFREYWTESMRQIYDYPLQVKLQAVDDEERATVETLKYTFKTAKDSQALEGFYTSLRGRRLVSFSGVFARIRKELQLSDFENVLTDDLPADTTTRLTFDLYKFDATGGLYKFYNKYEMELGK